MKLRLQIALIAILIVFSANAQAQKQGTELTNQQKLDLIIEQRTQCAREVTYKTWESYLDYAQTANVMVNMNNYEHIKLKPFYNNIPHLRKLFVADSVAYVAWQNILRTDEQYERIHADYISLKGVKDQEKITANTQDYNMMYDRLAKNNSNFIPARNAKNLSRLHRDQAIARALLDHYRESKKPFPTDIIPFRTIKILRDSYHALKGKEEELAIISKLERDLREQILREIYQIDKPDNQSDTGVNGMD